jgi:ribosome biogenesis GTPase
LNLEELGWDAFFADAFEPHGKNNLLPARVSARHHGPCELFTELGPMGGLPSGKLSDEELPAVGDWVAVRPVPGEKKAVIEAVLPRRSGFTRKEAGQRTVTQVVAANVDTVFVVTAFGFDLNPRRLERYLTSAWDSGASPVIVVNKLDLADDPEAELLEVEPVVIGVPVHPVSAVTGAGLEALEPYLGSGRTIALLGSSGVGKSTLVNHFAGRELLATAHTSAGGRGRHTTSHRELVPLPGRGGARHDVRRDQRARGEVPLLGLRPRAGARLCRARGARERRARPGALLELPKAPARAPGPGDPQGQPAALGSPQGASPLRP